MKITSTKVIDLLKETNSEELYVMLDNVTEIDRDGRTELQMLKNELYWLLDSYDSYETVRNDALTEAREIVANPDEYRKSDVMTAQWEIDEYYRLKKLWVKLARVKLRRYEK